MANELVETNLKYITSDLVDKIISGLGKDSTSKSASKWWHDNKIALIGLSVAEVMTILSNAKNRKMLAAHYDTLVASMSWQERIQFINEGVEQLKKSNSKKIRTATLIVSLIELAPKVLPIILMVL